MGSKTSGRSVYAGRSRMDTQEGRKIRRASVVSYASRGNEDYQAVSIPGGSLRGRLHWSRLAPTTRGIFAFDSKMQIPPRGPAGRMCHNGQRTAEVRIPRLDRWRRTEGRWMGPGVFGAVQLGVDGDASGKGSCSVRVCNESGRSELSCKRWSRYDDGHGLHRGT